MSATARNAEPSPEYLFTSHARARMSSRAVGADEIDMVMAFGRAVHTRGAVIYVMGHREVAWCRRRGISPDRCEGLHVVSSRDGAIITVYRNRDLSGLREKSRRCWH